MRRRKFITLLSSVAAAWPLATWAQQDVMPIIGFLHLGSERSVKFAIKAFRSGLTELGYTEGQNIRVLYRFAEGKADRLPELTKELVSLGALVIVTNGSASIRAAHNAAPSVPIVSWGSGDPVIMGWAHTLARPGGMITGLFLFITAAKPFELLKELRPEAHTFGCLMHASNPANPHAKKIVEDAGRAHGFNVEFIELKEESELADAFGRMRSLRAEGIVALPDAVLGSSAGAIAELARLHRLPSVGDGHPFVNAGGLFAFWVNLPAMAKRSSWYVDSILRGAHPGDLPAEQATEFKLLVNMKTAKELGLTIPTAILARADEVIE